MGTKKKYKAEETIRKPRETDVELENSCSTPCGRRCSSAYSSPAGRWRRSWP